MITKAIVEEIVDRHKVRVRVPFYDRIASSPYATATEDLSIATICTMPGALMNLQPGDVVFVEFEDRNKNLPVVLGHLSREIDLLYYPEITASALNVKADAHLSVETYIGDVKPSEIECLKGINKNLNLQLEILEQQVAKLNDKLHTHKYGCLIGNYPTEADANLILAHSANKIKLTGWQKEAADINGDGIVNSSDSLIVLKYLDGQDVSTTRMMKDFIYYDEDEK